MLLEHVWDFHFDPQTNVIDTQISRLRSKIDRDFDKPLLHTLRGRGYRLSASEWAVAHQRDQAGAYPVLDDNRLGCVRDLVLSASIVRTFIELSILFSRESSKFVADDSREHAGRV